MKTGYKTSFKLCMKYCL